MIPAGFSADTSVGLDGGGGGAWAEAGAPAASTAAGGPVSFLTARIVSWLVLDVVDPLRSILRAGSVVSELLRALRDSRARVTSSGGAGLSGVKLVLRASELFPVAVGLGRREETGDVVGGAGSSVSADFLTNLPSSSSSAATELSWEEARRASSSRGPSTPGRYLFQSPGS